MKRPSWSCTRTLSLSLSLSLSVFQTFAVASSNTHTALGMRQFQASHFGPFPGTFRVSAHSGLHWDRADEGGGAGVREQSRHTCG